MAAAAGRKLRIKYDSGGGAVAIAGARTDSLTINSELIDTTDKDDAGVRTLLDDVGVKSISLSVEGVMVDDTLQGLARGAGEGSTLHNFEIDIAALGTYSGAFAISNFEVAGAEGAEAMTFTASLESSGAVTFV